MNELLNQINFQYIFFKGERYDRLNFKTAINHLTDYLLKNIHSSSPFILFTAYNHIKTAIAYYAIIKAGKIAVVLDPESKSIELTEIIQDVDPAAIIFLNKESDSFKYNEEIVFRKGRKGFDINSDLKDVCTVAYTNAEDGFSKGAMLTADNLLSETNAVIKATELHEKSVSCALLPFSHLYGLVNGIILPTHSGGAGLITEINLLRITEIMKEIAKHKTNHFYTVPSLYYLLSKIPEIKELVSSFKICISGGFQLPKFIFENFYSKTNIKIHEGYGLTECSPAVSLDYQKKDPVPGSIGKALPGCELRIMDESDNECGDDKIGEICIKGNMLFKGYFNNEITTNNTIRNGWFHTGDLGKKDKDGYFYFIGLKKEMINMGANKVYPRKLERLIKMHKNILDVNVYKEDSLLQGSTVIARIKLRNTSKKSQEEIKNWCYTNLNNSTLPKKWLFD